MAPMLAVLLVAASLPAGAVAHMLIERGPTDQPLFRPLTVGAPTRARMLLQVLVTGGFLLIGQRFASVTVGTLVALLALITVLIALAIIDATTYRLPDRIVLPMLCGSIVWVAVVALVDAHPERIRAALCGAAVYFGVLLIAHLISPRGMGFGDVKLAALLGLFLGWTTTSMLDAVALVLWAMIIGFAVGTLVGLIILLRRRSNRPFPFGPFLVIGTVIALLASSRILAR